jgi:hypothetical protein
VGEELSVAALLPLCDGVPVEDADAPVLSEAEGLDVELAGGGEAAALWLGEALAPGGATVVLDDAEGALPSLAVAETLAGAPLGLLVLARLAELVKLLDSLGVRVWLGVSLALTLAEGELDGEAPKLNEAVAVCELETEAELVSEDDALAEDVAVPLPDGGAGDAVVVMLLVAGAVPLAVSEIETDALPVDVLDALVEGVALFDSEAPTDKEAVADAVDDPVPVALKELEMDALGVQVPDTLTLRLTDADGETDGVLEGVGLFDGVAEGVGVPEGAAPPVR